VPLTLDEPSPSDQTRWELTSKGILTGRSLTGNRTAPSAITSALIAEDLGTRTGVDDSDGWEAAETVVPNGVATNLKFNCC
jgi:hypothetical protein